MPKNILIMSFISIMGCASEVYELEGVRQLPPQEYIRALELADDPYLLDIRTPLEFRKHHLEGAENINFLSFSFGKKIGRLDTTKAVFIYCQTAHRSPHAAKKLWKQGFRNIVDLKGGFKALRK